MIVNVIGNGGQGGRAHPLGRWGCERRADAGHRRAGGCLCQAGRESGRAQSRSDQEERVAEGLRADAALRGTSEQEALQQSLSRIPLGRMAEPEEIANAVAFLASAKASYITGVNITMDGAQTPVVV